MLYWWKTGNCPSHSSFAFRSPVLDLPDGPQNIRHVLGPFTFPAFVISGTSVLLSPRATLKYMQRKTNAFFLLFLFSSSSLSVYWVPSRCQVSTLELEDISELRLFRPSSLRPRRMRLKEWISQDHPARELFGPSSRPSDCRYYLYMVVKCFFLFVGFYAVKKMGKSKKGEFGGNANICKIALLRIIFFFTQVAHF